jgi:NAD(P)-dependent dehydrogenase (short-subunit alcohol dehydrogenase family)
MTTGAADRGPKVALVTGASSGIGLATARLLAERGWTVHASARRVERMAALAERGVDAFSMDVTDDASLRDGVTRVLDRSGRVDLLVNNAGYGSYGALEYVPLSEAREQFEVNVFGAARLTQLLLPHLRAARAGRVILISSVGGVIYEPLGAWYHASKFALEGLGDSLRVELAPFGIDVVVVRPGPIRTEWNAIARRSLLERCSGTAYESMAASAARVLERADRPGAGSPPEVVARTVLEAAEAARPRTRYAAGRGAAAIVAARRLLPDRAFDAVVRRLYL